LQKKQAFVMYKTIFFPQFNKYVNNLPNSYGETRTKAEVAVQK
jgi:hypothetical protein